MATYYVGPGGSDSNNGTSWATRKLTLNGAENIPVQAGDTVYVAPGLYAETLTCDVTGSAGAYIIYIADVTGAYTDGVGGIVRITGNTDADESGTYTLSNNIEASGIGYRAFYGFTLSNAAMGISMTDCYAWTLRDMHFTGLDEHGIGIYGSSAYAVSMVFDRLLFSHILGEGIYMFSDSTLCEDNGAITNCIFDACTQGIYVLRRDGWVVRNCTFLNESQGVYASTLYSLGGDINVYNSVFHGCSTGLYSAQSGNIVEDYNFFSQCLANRYNVSSGSNSKVGFWRYADDNLYLGGYNLRPTPYWVPAANMPHYSDDGSGPTEDFFGITKPATNGKRTFGAVQKVPVTRDTTNSRSGSCLKLSDAGRFQIIVPVSDAETTISVYVKRESNYSGTNPQMIIRQPGQSSRTTTDTGSSGEYNLLTDTFTPAALPGYVIVELVSNNTASSGNYAVYFDDLTVE